MKKRAVTVRDQLRMVFRRKWALLVPSCLGVLVALPLWIVVPPKYRAVALVRREDLAISRSAPSTLLGQDLPSISLPALKAEILTWESLDRVIRQTKLDADLRTAHQWQAKREELRKSIRIRAVAQRRGLDLIEIAAVIEEPSLAEKIANAVADNYVEESKTKGRRDSRAQVSFLEKGAKDSLKKLRDTERELDLYKEDHFADLPEVRSNILSRLLEMRTGRTAKTLELIEAQNRLYTLEEQMQEVPRTITAEVTSEANPRAAELQEQLARRKRYLSSLLLRYTEEHPDVAQARNEMAAVEEELAQTAERVEGTEVELFNAVYQELEKDQLRLRQQIRAYGAALVQLEAEIRANEAEIRNVVNEEKRYADLARQRTEYSETYAQYRRNLVAARNRLEVRAEGSYGAEVQMAARALEPAIPYSLPRLKLMLMCILAGMALGVALMFGLEFADQSLGDMEEAAEVLGVPVLGTISTIVTPQQLATRRRRVYAFAALTAGILLVAAIGTYTYERAHPGTIEKVRQRVEQIIGPLTG